MEALLKALLGTEVEVTSISNRQDRIVSGKLLQDDEGFFICDDEMWLPEITQDITATNETTKIKINWK